MTNRRQTDFKWQEEEESLGEDNGKTVADFRLIPSMRIHIHEPACLITDSPALQCPSFTKRHAWEVHHKPEKQY